LFDFVVYYPRFEQTAHMSQLLPEKNFGAEQLGDLRREQILADLRSARSVRVTQLARKIGVSEMTIRRDLDLLAAEGLVERMHGGASLRRPSSHEEPGFDTKVGRNQLEKDSIAGAAVTLVKPYTAIGIGAGTTTWRFAQQLGAVANLIVVTNSVRIAEELDNHGRSDRTVILTGGVRTPSDALVGPVAEHALRTFQLDAVFLGTHGMSARSGFTSPNLAEAETNRVFLQTTERFVMLADHTKWNVAGLSTFASLDRPSTVISDARLPAEAQRALRESRSDVRIVQPETSA
jgi:DeoR/GlpR family transcriptional regulator of sugar metabolism